MSLPDHDSGPSITSQGRKRGLTAGRLTVGLLILTTATALVLGFVEKVQDASDRSS
jgi:hypothetical protein